MARLFIDSDEAKTVQEICMEKKWSPNPSNSLLQLTYPAITVLNNDGSDS